MNNLGIAEIREKRETPGGQYPLSAVTIIVIYVNFRQLLTICLCQPPLSGNNPNLYYTE